MGWKDKVAKSVWGAIKGSKKELKSSGTGTIKIKPQVHHTGTKSLIGKYKKAVSNVKTTDDVTDKKVKAIKSIVEHTKKWGGSEADAIVGAQLKERAQKGKK